MTSSWDKQKSYAGVFDKKEIIVFFIFVPLLLLSFYLLPSNIKSYLILKTEDPNLLSIFFSSYVHESFDHFIGNILSYFVLMFIFYIIETDRKRFYLIALIGLLFIPAITSLVSIYYLNTIKTFLGFSDIVAFYMGYLIYALYRYLKVNYIEDLNMGFLGFIVGVNIALVTTLWKSSVLFALSILLIACSLLFIGKRRIIKMINSILDAITHERFNNTLKTYLIIWYEITVIIIIVFYSFSLPLLVKFQIIDASSVSNIVSHALGWSFGVIVPILGEVLMGR